MRARSNRFSGLWRAALRLLFASAAIGPLSSRDAAG